MFLIWHSKECGNAYTQLMVRILLYLVANTVPVFGDMRVCKIARPKNRRLVGKNARLLYGDLPLRRLVALWYGT